MPAMSSSMPPYNGHVAGPSARRGNGNYSGNFGRGGYSSHGGMSRGGGGKRGGMASRGGHHRGPKPSLDQNNFLSYSSSSSTPYHQGGFQHQHHQQQQQPIVPFHQRANEYNMDGGGMSYPGPTVPDTTSYYHASTTPSRTATTTRKENFHWDAKRNEDGKSLYIFLLPLAACFLPVSLSLSLHCDVIARESKELHLVPFIKHLNRGCERVGVGGNTHQDVQ